VPVLPLLFALSPLLLPAASEQLSRFGSEPRPSDGESFGASGTGLPAARSVFLRVSADLRAKGISFTSRATGVSWVLEFTSRVDALTGFNLAKKHGHTYISRGVIAVELNRPNANVSNWHVTIAALNAAS
jgi:hypothetical protein